MNTKRQLQAAADKKAMQKLFDTSLAHIREQGVPSINKRSHACKYRSGKLSCAAAPFIINYKKSMEGCDWGTLASDGGIYEKDLDPMAVEYSMMVTRLQRAHDSAAQASTDDSLEFLPTYEDNMRRLAASQKLKYKARTA